MYCYAYRPVGGGKTVYSRPMERTAVLDAAEKISVGIPGKWITVWVMIPGTRLPWVRESILVKFKDGAMYPAQFSI